MSSSLRTTILLLVSINLISCNIQSTTVQGYLTCNGKPAEGVLVKLYDDGMIYDTSMGKTKTDANGFYTVAGAASGLTTIEPKLNIYTDCEDGIMPCKRKITIYVPKNKVSQSSISTQTFNAETIELSGKFKGESRDCIH